MKKTTFTLGMIGLAIQFASPSAHAQSNLEYRGGPTSTISQSDIQAIKSWSQNAMADIERLLSNIQPMLDASDVKRKLFNGMETVVANSEPKAADLLLRHAIYAGLTINKLIDQEAIRKGMNNTAQGTVDQQVRILKKSLTMAKEYYKSDFAYINGILSKKDANYANPKLVEFGVRFSQFLIKMSDGVLDASASYGMIRWSLGILASYMNQDSRNIAYASTIKYLNDELRQYPDIVTGQLAPEDVDCIKYVRELKRIAQGVYKEIAQTSQSISIPDVAIQSPAPAPSQPAPAPQTSTPRPRQDPTPPTNDNSLSPYATASYNARCGCYKVSIANTPAQNIGDFLAPPASMQMNGEIFVIGMGMDRNLYYFSNYSTSPVRIDGGSSVFQIEATTTYNGLPAVKYTNQSGTRYTINISGQSVRR